MHDNNSIDGGVILPDPLIDSDVDLRDFAYMPLMWCVSETAISQLLQMGKHLRQVFCFGVLHGIKCLLDHFQMMIVFLQILRVLVASLGNG